MKLVKHLLDTKGRDVIAISPDASVFDAIRLMAEKGIGAVVVLVSTMLQGITAKRADHLRKLLGVSRRTLDRWRTWWQAVFTQSSFWQVARRKLGKEEAQLPESLLNHFSGDKKSRLVETLRFLGPITGGSSVVKDAN